MIRKAQESDCEKLVDLVKIILDDMELAIFEKIEWSTLRKVLITAFKREGYRYDYRRAYVYEQQGEVIGVLYGYLAEEEPLIDAPLKDVMAELGVPFNPMFIDSEVFPDEWYLDSLAVSPAAQGQGVGSKLLAALPEIVKPTGVAAIGLNVDQQNPAAEKLYRRHGFVAVGTKKIGEHLYNHLQKKIEKS